MNEWILAVRQCCDGDGFTPSVSPRDSKSPSSDVLCVCSAVGQRPYRTGSRPFKAAQGQHKSTGFRFLLLVSRRFSLPSSLFLQTPVHRWQQGCTPGRSRVVNMLCSNSQKLIKIQSQFSKTKEILPLRKNMKWLIIYFSISMLNVIEF